MMRWLVLAALVMMLSACGHERNKDYAAMNKIPMKAVCVGRMLVDLPKGSPLEWQQQFNYAKVSKLPAPIDDAQKFWAFVKKRKTELAQPTSAHPNGSLGVYKQVGENAAIMQFQDPELPSNPELTPDIYFTERYLWLGHWAYKYQTGELFEKQAAALLPRIEKTFGQVEPISNYDPPAKAGFCIDSAMVVGKIGPIWSAASANVKQWKGVSVDAGAGEDDGSREKLSWQKTSHALKTPTPLEDLEMYESYAKESKRTNDDDRVVSMDVLRKRDVQLAGMKGQEIAFKLKLANGQEYYRFEWDSIDNAERTNKASFSFSLMAGSKDFIPDYVPPPPQEDLLALWDAMLDSLKPRPSAR